MVNGPEEIYRSFQPYYEVNDIGERAEPDQYCAPEAERNAAQIKDLDEVEGFCGVFFRPTTTQTPATMPN